MADEVVPAPLSQAWRTRLAGRLAQAPPVEGRRVALGQVVTGMPGGDVAWTVVAGGGEPARLIEGVGDADVCLVGDEDTARRLLAGTPAATLLAEGRLKVRGNAGALVEAQGALASLGAALSGDAGS